MNKCVGAMLVIGGIIFVAGTNQIKKRSEKMRKQNIEVDKPLVESVKKLEEVKVVARDKNGLTDAEKRELTERFEGMSQAEIDIFMDLVPVELCMARIQKELDRAKEFESTIKLAMAGFNIQAR